MKRLLPLILCFLLLCSTQAAGAQSFTPPAVKKIIAGANITISPTSGIGNVTVNGSAGGATSITGDGVLITNSASTGAVTLTLGSAIPAGVTGSSLTSLGTIGTGVWHGTAIVPQYGGTGLSTLTAHYVLVGAGTSNVVLAAPGTSGWVLTSNGASADPTFQAPSGGGVTSFSGDGTLITNSGSTGAVTVTLGTVLPSGVVTSSLTTVGTIGTGTWAGTNVALNHGGTNAALTAANGGLTYSTASALALTAAPTAHGVLLGEGAAAPSWTAAGTANYPLVANSSADPTFQQLGLTTGVTGILPVANGGTGLNALTAHYVLVGAGSSNTTLVAPSSTVGYVLTSNGSSSDPSFQAVAGGTGAIVFGGMAATQRTIPTSGTLTGDYQQATDYTSTGDITCNRCRLKVVGNVTFITGHTVTVSTEVPGGGTCLVANDIAPGGSGLGGGQGGNQSGVSPNAGGGGGNGGAGGYGGGYGAIGGIGGSTYYIENQLAGSGGGSGMTNATFTGGAGGAGGGAMYIEATGNITITSNISAVGGVGVAGTSTYDAGGGGGSGGTIEMLCNGTWTLSGSTTIDVTGGAGGAGGVTRAGAGGGGGGGKVFVRSGGSATTTGTITKAGGAAGAATGAATAAAAGATGTSDIVGGATYPVRSAP